MTVAKKSADYTKAYIKGNAVYLPVTLFIKGKYRTEWMLLDTGCTRTSMPYKYFSNMNPNWGSKVSARVANGATVSGYEVQLATIKVGIKSKRNFPVSAYKRSGADNRGLLVMDFLKDNPFRIRCFF